MNWHKLERSNSPHHTLPIFNLKKKGTQVNTVLSSLWLMTSHKMTHLAGKHSSQVHICATEYWQLVMTFIYANLSQINTMNRTCILFSLQKHKTILFCLSQKMEKFWTISSWSREPKQERQNVKNESARIVGWPDPQYGTPWL